MYPKIFWKKFRAKWFSTLPSGSSGQHVSSESNSPASITVDDSLGHAVRAANTVASASIITPILSQSQDQQLQQLSSPSPPALSSLHNPTTSPSNDRRNNIEAKTSPPADIKQGWKRTAYSGTKLALDVVKDSSDAFIPLKSVAGGLAALLKHYDQFISNKDDVLRLILRVESLVGSLAGPPRENDIREIERRRVLEINLKNVLETLDPMLNQSNFSGFLNNVDQAAKITGIVEDIRNAIIDYQTSLQQGLNENTMTIIESVAQSRQILRTVIDKLPPAKNAEFTKKPFQLRAIRKEFTSKSPQSRTQGQWIEIQAETLNDEWVSGSYWSTFVADTSGCTIIYVETSPTNCEYISWCISAPNSPWYPGTCSGTIRIERDYPFSQPWLRFSTPIFSPKVGPGGYFSSAFDLGQWSPSYTIMDLLYSVAAMIVLDPQCRSPSLFGIPLGHHDLNYEISRFCTDDPDAFMRATNFFSRAYAQGTLKRISNPAVTKHEVDTSLQTIQELLQYFTGSRCLETAPTGSSANDPVKAFAGMESTEEWIAEEKRWADAISLRCQFKFAEV